MGCKVVLNNSAGRIKVTKPDGTAIPKTSAPGGQTPVGTVPAQHIWVLSVPPGYLYLQIGGNWWGPLEQDSEGGLTISVDSDGGNLSVDQPSGIFRATYNPRFFQHPVCFCMRMLNGHH